MWSDVVLHSLELITNIAQSGNDTHSLAMHQYSRISITEYINAGGALDIAQRIAGHSELSTTEIYDRSQDRVTIAEIERVSLEPFVRANLSKGLGAKTRAVRRPVCPVSADKTRFIRFAKAGGNKG